MSTTRIEQRWSTSKSHRKNMLGDFNVAGIGTASANGQTYATLIVGSQ